MDITEAATIAKLLMSEHNLAGWSFGFNSARRQLGVCKEHCKRIELSRHYVLHNPAEHVVDTILHEIAHALVGTKHGHDNVWRSMCRQLGCAPKACDRNVQMPEGNWRAECPSCRRSFTRHRKPGKQYGLYCRRCGPVAGSLRFTNVKVAYEKRRIKMANGQAQQLMLKLFS